MCADFHRTFVNDDSFIRGAARLMWAGTTITFPTKIGDVINLSTFDAMSGWNDLGATKTGIQLTINNTEESFDVDQITGELRSEPTGWECSVGTQLAEMTLQRLQLAWEGSAITTQNVDGTVEDVVGFGQPTSYTQRILAVMFQRPNGKIRGYFFRKVQRTPQESSVTHSKTGEQISIPVRFRALPDLSQTDIKKRFFMIHDQK